MARFKQLYRIIEDVVNAITWTLPFTQAPGVGNQVILTLTCTAYLNSCAEFLIGVDIWRVIEEDGFKFNEELIVEPVGHTNPIIVTDIILTIPTYYHGTVKLTNAEHGKNRKQNDADISPVIYLYETLSEKVTLEKKNLIERTATAKIFILMSNDFGDMIQVDYDSELYDPMSNIEDKLVEGLINNTNISQFTESYARINHDQFGYTDRNGALKRIFDDKLSALELDIPLNISRCSSKNNNC